VDVIDLDKTRKAFDFLAETSKGHTALATLRSAFDRVQGEVEPRLNRGEFLYVLRQLVSQLNVTEMPTQPADVSGYTFQNVQGVVFQGKPGAVKLSEQTYRFPGVNRITPGGFQIRPDI